MAAKQRTRQRATPRTEGTLPPRPDRELSDRERLAWLLEFLRRDLSALREGERLDLRADVLRFLHRRPHGAPFPPPDPYAIALGRARGHEAPAVSDEMVIQLQEAVRGCTRVWSAGLRWAGLERPIVPVWEPQPDGTIATVYVSPTLASALLASAASLLAHEWPRLKRCAREECAALFLPRHGRQRYDTLTCSSRARWAEWAKDRDTDPKKKRNYEQEYKTRKKREAEKKYGLKNPNLRINHRRRKGEE